MESNIKIEDVQARIAEAHEHTADARGADWWSMLANALATDAEALLASHRALAEAGEEMPSDNDVAMLFEAWPIENRPSFEVTDRICDLFRPHFARRTQQTIAAETRYASAFERAKRAEDERDALRQRAERAEREAVSLRQYVNEARSERDESTTENAALRVRIAELESRSVEPGAGVVERLAQMVSPMRLTHSAHDIVRAVISALAEMGDEACREATDAIHQTALTLGMGPKHHKAIDRLLAAGSRLSPVIGALRARVAEFEAKFEPARVGVDAARLPLEHYVLSQAMCEPCAGDDPEGIAEAARLGRL